MCRPSPFLNLYLFSFNSTSLNQPKNKNKSPSEFIQYWNSTEHSATDGYLSSVATISNGNANKANGRGVRAIRKY